MDFRFYFFSLPLLGSTMITIFTSFIIVSLFFLCMKRNHTNSNSLESYSYQYLQQNGETYETNFGFVTIPKRIETHNYVSYEESNGNRILISNFGEQEYECTGTCFCDESARRNVGSQVASKGFSFLLVAFSSVFAFERAKNFFESKCANELSDCHVSLTYSVDDCRPIFNENSKSTDSDKKEEEEKRVYFCYGNCVENRHHVVEDTQKQFEHIKCETLRQEGEIEVYEREMIVKSSSYNQAQKFLFTALNKFQETFLKSFCKQSSGMEYVYENYHTESGKKTPYQQHRFGYGCVGKSNFQGGKKSCTKNVKCRQINPEPKGNSRKYQEQKWWDEKKKWDDTSLDDMNVDQLL